MGVGERWLRLCVAATKGAATRGAAAACAGTGCAAGGDGVRTADWFVLGDGVRGDEGRGGGGKGLEHKWAADRHMSRPRV